MKRTIKNNRKNRKMLQMVFRKRIKQLNNPQVYRELIIEKQLDKKVSRKIFDKINEDVRPNKT